MHIQLNDPSVIRLLGSATLFVGLFLVSSTILWWFPPYVSIHDKNWIEIVANNMRKVGVFFITATIVGYLLLKPYEWGLTTENEGILIIIMCFGQLFGFGTLCGALISIACFTIWLFSIWRYKKNLHDQSLPQTPRRSMTPAEASIGDQDITN